MWVLGIWTWVPRLGSNHPYPLNKPQHATFPHCMLLFISRYRGINHCLRLSSCIPLSQLYRCLHELMMSLWELIILCHLWVHSPGCLYTVSCSRQSVKCIKGIAYGVLLGKTSCVRKYLIYKDVSLSMLNKNMAYIYLPALLNRTDNVFISCDLSSPFHFLRLTEAHRHIFSFSRFYCCHYMQREASHLQ